MVLLYRWHTLLYFFFTQHQLGSYGLFLTVAWYFMGAYSHHILPVHSPKGRHMDYCQLTTTIVIVSAALNILASVSHWPFSCTPESELISQWSMCSISPCITRLPSQMADPVSTPANSIWRLLNLTSSLIFGISHFFKVYVSYWVISVIISEFEHLFKCFLTFLVPLYLLSPYYLPRKN